MSACSSCEAPMIWAVSLAGRRIPMDATPLRVTPERELGVFVLLRRTGESEPLAMPTSSLAALTLEDASRLKVPLFVSHFATCPNAEQHRGRAT